MGATIQRMRSGNRVRTKEDGFDLDLTYITEDVVAMSLPSRGPKKFLRIDGQKVSDYFKQKYDDESLGNIMIYNLSGRKYNYEPFNNRVKEFGFPNHGVPTLRHLWTIITDMKSQSCISVVHCKAGKGRTGTVIASYLLLNRECETADEAIKLFNSQRTTDEKAVQVPSQVRYIHYIEELVKYDQEKITSEIFDNPPQYVHASNTIPGIKRHFARLFLETIVLRGYPTVFKKKKHRGDASPKFKFSVGFIIETHSEQHEFATVFDEYFDGISDECTLELEANVLVRGDTKIKCYKREHNPLKFAHTVSKVNANKITAMKHLQACPEVILFRYNFHSAFTKSKGATVLLPSDLDTPANLTMADPDLPNFMVELKFRTNTSQQQG